MQEVWEDRHHAESNETKRAAGSGGTMNMPTPDTLTQCLDRLEGAAATGGTYALPSQR